MKNEIVLIAGGTGLVGQALKKHFEREQNEVIVLTRNKSLSNKTGFAFWNPDEQLIDEIAFKRATVLINLSGETIAQRWTQAKKISIVESRTKAATLLAKTCSSINKQFKHIVCASAIGLYPQKNTCHSLYEEHETAGNDFLSETVKTWEAANDQLRHFGSFTQLRIGVVLANEGGMLPTIKPLFSKHLGSVIGSGEQGISWIHLSDLVNMINHVATNKIQGTFNAVAPTPVSQKTMAKLIANQLNKKILLPATPSWLLKLALGEQALLATHGAYVSSQKIQSYSFEFEYEKLDHALKNLLHENLN